MTTLQTLTECVCQRPNCGKRWYARVPEPQKCPKCGSREWREPKDKQDKAE